LNANAGRNSQLAEVEDLGILLQRARASGAGFERARREVYGTLEQKYVDGMKEYNDIVTKLEQLMQKRSA
jgi:ribosomal protein L13E